MLVLPVPARGSTLLDVALLARVRSTTHSQALHAAHYILVLPRRVTRVWLGAACVTSPFNVAQFQPQATFLQQTQSYAHVQDLPLVCPRHFALRLSPDFWEPARTHQSGPAVLGTRSEPISRSETSSGTQKNPTKFTTYTVRMRR
jgi:hypothetical protein